MFEGSALSLTLGVEEELMLVDRVDGRLVPDIEQVLLRAGGDPRFQAEFRACQVEVATRPCLSAADAGRELAAARLDLDDACRGRVATIACGTHPTADVLGPVTDGERYAALAAANPWAARSMLTCGLHVHVGVAGADRALAVYNALRSYLPELAALSGNSPYVRKRATGLASTRMVLNRSLARHGVPPSFADWQAYAGFTRWGSAGTIPDPSYHWWDLRLNPGLGTVELRICDAQTAIEDTVSLVAVAQALVAWLVERHDAGEELPVHDGYKIAESVWLAAHAGVSREVLDLDTGVRRSVRERLAEVLDLLQPTARELGTVDELARLTALADASGADRQRRAVDERGIDHLVTWLADETIASAHRYRDRSDVPAAATAVASPTFSPVA